MYVNCPKCGLPGAGWEDEEMVRFCGKCEEEYQRAELEHELTEKERVRQFSGDWDD
jgi:endogenous inhibitor of DNA gyrase (YacG/DUF329 family)